MKSPREAWLPVFCLVVAGGLAWSAAGEAAEARVASGSSQDLLPPARLLVTTGVLTNRLRETSGVAVSRKDPGVLWSHNDSGGRARLFAVSLDGENLGRVDVEGAGFVDWESISGGPCPASWEEEDCLYIGDIGDNLGRRRDVTLYVVPEPEPDDESVDVGGEFDFTYPTGPDDAEALAIDGAGNMIVVTKGREGSIRLYQLDASELADALDSDERVTLEPGQDIGIRPDRDARRLVTGAAVSPTGVLAVRTYLEVFFFEPTAEGWSRSGGCHFWGRNRTGEAIDFLNADEMVLTTEAERNTPAMVFRARCSDPAGFEPDAR